MSRKSSRLLRPMSPDDVLDAEVTKVAVADVVKALKAAMEGNPHRLVRTLTPIEVMQIADAAIAAFIKMRSQQEAMSADLNDPLPESWQL